jgi:photosystem II stability/assembly factor-like uncharacterized protein
MALDLRATVHTESTLTTPTGGNDVKGPTMKPIRLFAATGDAVARIDVGAEAATQIVLEDCGAQCVAADPVIPGRVFVGTFDSGVFRTRDGGELWEPTPETVPQQRVLSIALSPSDRPDGRVALFAGTEPSAVFRSPDDGATWQAFPRLGELPSASTWSFPPRPWTHHVRWIAFHPADAATFYAGIELGGVMVTRDGGQNWEDRKPGSQHDAHAVATHAAAPDHVFEAAGGGVAHSTDAGATWRPADEGMDRHYVWGLAIDAADPDLWYASATYGANYAHRRNGDAQAVLYRKRGDAPWEALGGPTTGLERPLPYMPYALVAPRDQPNVLVAGMQDGVLFITEDAGETWRRVETGLPSLLALSEGVPA